MSGIMSSGKFRAVPFWGEVATGEDRKRIVGNGKKAIMLEYFGITGRLS